MNCLLPYLEFFCESHNHDSITASVFNPKSVVVSSLFEISYRITNVFPYCNFWWNDVNLDFKIAGLQLNSAFNVTSLSSLIHPHVMHEIMIWWGSGNLDFPLELPQSTNRSSRKSNTQNSVFGKVTKSADRVLRLQNWHFIVIGLL